MKKNIKYTYWFEQMSLNDKTKFYALKHNVMYLNLFLKGFISFEAASIWGNRTARRVIHNKQLYSNRHYFGGI